VCGNAYSVSSRKSWFRVLLHDRANHSSGKIIPLIKAKPGREIGAIIPVGMSPKPAFPNREGDRNWQVCHSGEGRNPKKR